MCGVVAKRLCSFCEALLDSGSEVVVWAQGWAGPSGVWLAVYSCSPPPFGEGFTPCLGSVWSSAAAAPPTVHTCTLHTTHHDARRTQDSREWMEHVSSGCGRTERPGEGMRRPGEPGPPSGDILTICTAAPRQFLFQTLLVS